MMNKLVTLLPTCLTGLSQPFLISIFLLFFFLCNKHAVLNLPIFSNLRSLSYKTPALLWREKKKKERKLSNYIVLCTLKIFNLF